MQANHKMEALPPFYLVHRHEYNSIVQIYCVRRNRNNYILFKSSVDSGMTIRIA